MPIDVGETTTGMESTDAAVSTDATESVLATTTTEEPSTDHEDPSVWAPSQNVEVRLHPQFLRTEEPKGPLSTLQEPSTTTTTTATTSEEDAYILGSSIFGRKMEVQHQQQQPQHGSFGVQTGRVRSKDNLGAALRRAVTGSPAVQRLQQSTSRMGLRNTQLSSARDKAGEITGRKIVGFGSLSSSNLPAPKLPSNSAVRKETLFKNRPAVGHGGETPAGTHIESLSSHWLYGTGKGMQIVKLQESTICFISWWHINYTGSVFFVVVVIDTRKPADTFRLSSTDRLLVLGLREKTLLNTSTIEVTTVSPTRTPTTTTTTKTVRSPANESEAPTNQVEVTIDEKFDIESTTTRSTTTTTRTPSNSGITRELNYGTPETNYATPELNYATPEINYGTTEGHQDKTTVAESTVTTPTSTEMIPPSSSTETNPFTSSKAKATAGQILPSSDLAGGESIKELDKSPLDGPAKQQEPQELGSLTAGDHDGDQETGLNMGELDNSEFDQDAHKYLVEEKTHDGYIIGEFGVISPSSDILRGVRYTAHGSTDPQLIQEMLRIFWSL